MPQPGHSGHRDFQARLPWMRRVRGVEMADLQFCLHVCPSGPGRRNLQQGAEEFHGYGVSMGVRTTRLPGLDGIRAIAAICIILGHIPQKDFGSWSVQSLPVPDLCAYTFLVLSGFQTSNLTRTRR